MVLSVVPHSVYPEIINISGEGMDFLITMSSGVVGRVDIIAEDHDVEVWMGSGTFANIGHIRWLGWQEILIAEEIGVRTNHAPYLDSDSYTYLPINTSGTSVASGVDYKSFVNGKTDYDHDDWRFGNVILQQKSPDRAYSYYLHKHRNDGDASGEDRVRRIHTWVEPVTYTVTGTYSEVGISGLTYIDDAVFLYKTDADDNTVFVAQSGMISEVDLYEVSFSGTGSSSSLATISYPAGYNHLVSQIYDEYLYVMLYNIASYVLTLKYLKIDMTTGDYSEATIGTYSNYKYAVSRDVILVPKIDGNFIWAFLFTTSDTDGSAGAEDKYTLLYGDEANLHTHQFWERTLPVPTQVPAISNSATKFAGQTGSKSYIAVTAGLDLVSGGPYRRGWYCYFNDTLSLNITEYNYDGGGSFTDLRSIYPLSTKTGSAKYYISRASSSPYKISIVDLETNVIYHEFDPADYSMNTLYPTSYPDVYTQVPRSDIDSDNIYLQGRDESDLGDYRWYLLELKRDGTLVRKYNSFITQNRQQAFLKGQEVIIGNNFIHSRYNYTSLGDDRVVNSIVYFYSLHDIYVRKART